MDEKRIHERSAPWYSIPSRQIVSVEHPCVVKNIDKGIETLQGHSGISQLINPPRVEAPAILSLRPEDAMSRPLRSISTASNNVLLRVVVPKRTGRRRKRGSSEAFTDAPATDGEAQDASHMQRTLQDNVGKYRVEAIGMVDRTHVFRGMPDFVFSTAASPFTNRFREHILPFDYEKLKGFTLDMSKGGTTNVDIIPPPAFSYNDIPFNYTYRQTSTIRQAVDKSGEVTTINTQRINKVWTHLVPYDIPSVPSKPRDDCPPLETADKMLQETVKILHPLFHDRPAWTRRALRNHITSDEQKYVLRSALAYIGYIFRSGPWRDAIIKFNHDPRNLPESRIYQTLMFRIPLDGDPDELGHGRRQNFQLINYDNPTQTASSAHAAAATEPTPPNTHLFTGHPPLPRDGKTWMICDITDPLLRTILTTRTIRSTCDALNDGWYGNLTLAKTRTIMRSKIHTLLTGKTPRDEDFKCILGFPENVRSEEELKRVVSVNVGGGEGSREMGLAADVRAAVRTAPGRVRRGGLGFYGLDERVGYGGVGVEEEGENDYEDEFEGGQGGGGRERGGNRYDEEEDAEGEDDEDAEGEEVNEEDDEENEGRMDIAPS